MHSSPFQSPGIQLSGRIKTILLKVKILMHYLHIEAKEVCIINRAQKIESQSTKYVLKKNSLGRRKDALLKRPAQLQRNHWNPASKGHRGPRSQCCHPQGHREPGKFREQMGIRSVKQTPEVPATVPGTMGRPRERQGGKEEVARACIPSADFARGSRSARS